MKSTFLAIVLFSAFGFISLMPIFLLGVIVGPQELHYYNLTIIGIVILGVSISLIGINFKAFWKIENVVFLIAALFTLSAFSLFSKYWIDNKYGYGNWEFENMWTITPNQKDN